MSTDNYASEDATQELLRIGKWPEPLRLAYLLEKEMLWPLHGKAADCLRKLHEELEAIKQARSAPVQVSPLEFVTMVMDKEHLVGKPLFWAEWPNKEMNT
jgi:hypothetical protein